VSEVYLTLHDIPMFLREKTGIKISYSTLSKWCSPAINKGPQPFGYWGPRPYFSPNDVLSWAAARMTTTRNRAA
jgi:hypothetical protein